MLIPHLTGFVFPVVFPDFHSLLLLFDQSVDPVGIINLAISDSLGKISDHEYVSYEDFFFERLRLFEEYMSRPYVMGRDLVDAGIKPSRRFSGYLDYAHKLRLAGVAKESALKQTLAMAEKQGDYVKPEE